MPVKKEDKLQKLKSEEMRHLSDDLINKAEIKIQCHVKCIDKFGLWGSKNNVDDVSKVCLFLLKNGVKYEQNRNIVWVDSLSDLLKEIFRK
jgi:hypothetical protein